MFAPFVRNKRDHGGSWRGEDRHPTASRDSHLVAQADRSPVDRQTDGQAIFYFWPPANIVSDSAARRPEVSVFRAPRETTRGFPTIPGISCPSQGPIRAFASRLENFPTRRAESERCGKSAR